MDEAGSSKEQSNRDSIALAETRGGGYDSYLDFELPYTPEEHAAITFKYISSANRKHLDLTFESNGKIIAQTNRLLVAAFSPRLEHALLKAPTGAATLEFDTSATGIDEDTLGKLVDYLHTGTCRSSPQMLHAADFLGCAALKELLDATSESDLEVHDDWHEIRFLEQLARFRKESKFLDCNIISGRLGVIRCHRLLMCAHSRHMEAALSSSLSSSTVTIRIDSRNVHISTENLKTMVDFAYTGVLDIGRRRLRMLRVSAFDLGMDHLVELIDHKVGQVACEEQDVPRREEYDMNFASPAGEEVAERVTEQEFIRSFSLDSSDKDQELSMLDGASAEEITAQAADDYDSIYEEFVMGPRRGRRTIARMTRNKYQPLVVRGATTISLPDDEHHVSVPAITMSFLQENERKTSAVDSFGYGLPEIVGTSDVTVPLVVGNQRAMMEKPFKCPYCEHRSKEKSGLEKHVRSIHTLEAPYKCKYCNQSFKVQSNMVRHIRAHTGEKPYACKKCGVSYADKKNMDAHVFREHLRMRELECTAPGCSARFWRHDRFALHCLKRHVSSVALSFCMNTLYLLIHPDWRLESVASTLNQG
ncbi:unnamed protein product [Cylicocyclus nassatus]|uniref:Zinc finger, C2H2 type n=1 Tax=Cylicocyclus nassatus TaxID=53992 RepID=A0AA36M386_CYLNA|nr:unnamed protein product [Cylicocyclus nassatus]